MYPPDSAAAIISDLAGYSGGRGFYTSYWLVSCFNPELYTSYDHSNPSFQDRLNRVSDTIDISENYQPACHGTPRGRQGGNV